MIKVVKRDGSVEPFQIEKINSWWMWASKQHNIPLGEGLEAVQRAVRSLSQETTSEKIQRALITELIALKRWSTVMMAGTLEASLVHKRVHGNTVPSAQAHFTNLLSKGYVVSFPLNQQEWDEINKLVDHQRDFAMPQFAIRYIMDSYALGNVVTNERVETPQFIYLRMAIAVGCSYPEGERLDVIKDTYELLSTKVISAPTPNFTHLGTSNNGLASCFPAGSKVLTSEGIKAIEDVRTGDLVVTHNNQLKPVYHTQSKPYTGKLTLLNSTATFLHELTPTEDHRIYGIKKLGANQITADESVINREWIKADNLRVGDYVKLGYEDLVETEQVFLWDVIKNSEVLENKYVLQGNVVRRPITYVESDTRRYPDIENFNIRQKDVFRLLGYYLAEGCVCTPTTGSKHLIFTFNIKEIDYIQDVKAIIEKFGGKVGISENPNDNSTKVTTYSKPITALMLELAGTGFSNKLLVPSVMRSEKILQEELLCGLIRGDGCAVISGYVVTLYNVNLIRQIRDIGLRCKLHLAISKSRKLKKGATEPDATIRFSVDGAGGFATNVGKNLEKIRKNKRFNGANILFLSDGAYTRIRMLSSKDVTCEVYDLSVEDDASFTVSGVAVHNCCLYGAGDDRKSLAAANLITYVMTYSSAGLGYHQNVRSVGDPVRGGKIEHQGEMFYLKSNAANAAANRQAKRGGAINAFLPAYSKEIDYVLAGREPTASPGKALNGIDISLVLTRDFIRRAVKSQPAISFSEYSHPEMFKSMYSGDPAELEALMADAVAQNLDANKLINPRATMGNLGRVTVSTGRNFAFLTDNANYHTPFKDPITGSNLCVAPETLVLTKFGQLPIKSLANRTLDIWNGEEWSQVTGSKTGENQKLLKVTTDSGYTLDCTPEHKWYVAKGYSGKFVEKRTHELVIGDKLIKFDLPVIQGTNELELAYVNGFYSGDGCLTDQGQRIYLYHDKQDLQNQFTGIGDWTVQPKLKRMYGHYHNLQDKFFVPTSDYSVQSRLNWLAGYLDADGCVYRNQSNQQLTAGSNNLPFLKNVQLMLQTLGVQSKVKLMTEAGIYDLPANDGSGLKAGYHCEAVYRLLITSVDSQKLLDLGLQLQRLKLIKHTPQRSATQFVKIESVVDYGRVSDTYCFTESKRHMGMFNGILTGQCMEIMNPVKPYKEISDLWRTDDHVEGEVSMCNLGAVNHDLVADDPELHKRACKALLRMIDYCIHYGYYELTHIGYTAKKRMNAAVGVMNTATYMARKHLRFDSPEGLKSVSEFAERHMYYLIESSLELGIEKGNAPWMHKTKWSGYTNKNGEYISAWMPIDTQNKRLANELGLKPLMPWEDLRARVAANKGHRFSVLAGMMPGESSSKALGAANSIYPIRDTGLSKTDSTTAIDWCAVGAGEAEYDYQLAFTMSTLATTKYYAAWQMWVDGGISGDYWLPFEKGQNVIEIDDILEKYSQMYAYGLKSHYYTVPKTQKSNAEKDKVMESLLERATLQQLQTAADTDDRFYDGSGCSGGACSI